MSHSKITTMVEGAVMIALATVLSFIKVFNMPWGGSITLLSMLPIIVFSIKHGVARGMAVSFIFALIQFGQGVSEGLFGWGLTPAMLVSCILLDYIVAFSVLGLGGLFRKKGLAGWIAGTVIALLLRFACHFTSGVVIWGSIGKLWSGFETDNTYLYSLVYNGCYMLPEIVFTTIAAVILYKVPQTKKLLAGSSAQA